MSEIIRHEFPTTIKLVNIGDIHRGSSACDANFLHKVVDYVKNTENCYWVSTADMLETALRGDKFGAIYHSMSLQEEIDTLVEELSPIADKCLGFVDSNHHGRVEKAVGLDVNDVLATKLNIPFLGDYARLNIVCDRNSYHVHMHHGVGGGSTPGGKSNASIKTSTVVIDADLYLSGHTHCYNHFAYDVQLTDRKRNHGVELTQHFLTTGHFLDYEKSYATKALYKKAPKCVAIAILTGHPGGNMKKITPVMFT